MDYAFSTRSLLPREIGVGAVPVGVGAASATKHKPHAPHRGFGGFTPTAPVKANWVLAYAYGDKGPRVKIAGHGFSYAGVLQNFIASKAPASYFYFSGDGGTFLFSCIYMGGTPVVRLATNGLQRSAGLGRTPAGPTGVGIATNAFKPLSTPPQCANWTPVYPGDGSATSTNVIAALGAGTIDIILATVSPVWSKYGGSTGGGWIRNNGAYHFLFGSPEISTGGEPVGTLLMKYDGTTISACTVLSTAPVSVPVSVPVAVSPPATIEGPTPVTSTDAGSYQWGTYMWQYFAANSGDVPTQPPPGQVPAGMWVNTTGLQFDWYPGAQGDPTAAKAITDPSGNTWYVYCSGYGANNEGAGVSYLPPAAGSTTPPAQIPSSTGYWSATIHPYYQVWIPTTGMSVDEEILLVLLGLLVIGGGTYYLMS